MAQKMKENEKKWINLSLKKKISYLEEILSLVSLCSPSWVGLQSTTVCGIPKEREEEEGKEKREEGEGEGEEGKKGEEEEGEGEEGKGVELGEGEGVDVEKFGQICGDGYMIGPGMCAGYIHLLLETLKVLLLLLLLLLLLCYCYFDFFDYYFDVYFDFGYNYC